MPQIIYYCILLTTLTLCIIYRYQGTLYKDLFRRDINGTVFKVKSTPGIPVLTLTATAAVHWLIVNGRGKLHRHSQRQI
jgi:hypothetical protein